MSSYMWRSPHEIGHVSLGHLSESDRFGFGRGMPVECLLVEGRRPGRTTARQIAHGLSASNQSSR
jgi:hypothetical protein